MSIRSWLLPLALLLLTSPAQAQLIKQHYVGGDLGYHATQQSFPVTANAGTQSASGTDKRKTSAFNGHFYYGMAFNHQLAVEIGVTLPWQFKEEKHSAFADVDPTYPGHKNKEELSGSLFEASLLYRPLGSEPGFFVKAGGTYSSVQFSQEIPTRAGTGTNGNPTYDLHKSTFNKKSGVGILVGIGYDYPVAPHINVRASVVRYQGLGGYFDAYSNNVRIGMNYGF